MIKTIHWIFLFSTLFTFFQYTVFFHSVHCFFTFAILNFSQVQRHKIACPFFQNRMCDFWKTHLPFSENAHAILTVQAPKRHSSGYKKHLSQLYNDLHLPLGIGMAKRLVNNYLSLCNAVANPTCHPLARGHGCGLLYARRLMTKRFLILNSQLWIIDCLFCQGGAKGVYTWIIVHTTYCNLQIFNCKLWFVNCQLIPLPRGRWEILIERFI